VGEVETDIILPSHNRQLRDGWANPIHLRVNYADNMQREN
jgi:hypothetical protein